MKTRSQELEEIFERANQRFLEKNPMLFEMKVSERTLCGALMIELHEAIKDTKYKSYFVDVEYNRNIGGSFRHHRKTIRGSDEQIITVHCDLIVHGRGQHAPEDNLVALEMKKSTGRKQEKEKDRARLCCLTQKPEESVWSYEGNAFPEHVCGYELGIYYEINLPKKRIRIEYYRDGRLCRQYEVETAVP